QRTKSHLVGMGTASSAASRSRTVRGRSPRRRCALSSCIPVSWLSSMPRRMPVRKRRKRRPLPTVGGRGGEGPEEGVCFRVVQSSQLAQQHAQTYASAQEKEAEAVADHVREVHA